MESEPGYLLVVDDNEMNRDLLSRRLSKKGHRVAVVDADGEPCAPGVEGVIAVKRPDPVMFLEYWNRPEDTAGKFIGDWCVLGDLAWRKALEKEQHQLAVERLELA